MDKQFSDLGIDQDKIKKIGMELSVLRSQGLLIDLDIRGTGMFTRSASWTDIGISDSIEDPRHSRFTTGQKYLIPEEQIKKLKSVETRMRQWLEKLSREVSGFAPYRWMPYTAYGKWREKWNELYGDFESVKAEIIANYDQYQAITEQSFREVAETSWKSITMPGYDWVIDGAEAYDHDTFIEMVVNNVITKFPSIEEIEEKLTADYSPALVYGQEDFAKDQAKADEIHNQQLIDHAAATARANEEYLQSQILREDLAHERQMHDLEVERRQLEITAMYKAEAEHIRQRLAKEISPYEEIFTALRNQFSNDAADMLASIKKNGHVRGKIAEKGRGLLELFDLMATHDDKELRNRLLKLRETIGQVGADNGPTRSTEEVKAILTEIQDLAHTAKDDLVSNSRFSLLDL